MAISSRLNRNSDRDLAMIAVRVDDAQMTWIAAEVEPERALRVWYEPAAPNRAGAYLAYRAAGEREEAAGRDLQRLCELIRP